MKKYSLTGQLQIINAALIRQAGSVRRLPRVWGKDNLTPFIIKIPRAQRGEGQKEKIMAKKQNSGKFAALAKEATSLSEILKGRTKIDVDELYGEEITITGFDIMTMTDKTKETKEYAVCTYAEDEGAFFFGGTVLTKICKSWLADYESCEEASEALKAEGGVVIKMSKGKTKNGNNITNVEIL